MSLQLNSQLSKKVVALCSELREWVLKTREPPDHTGTIPLASDERIDEVMDHVEEVFSPKLIKVLHDELGLNVAVTVCRDRTYNCMMMPVFKKIGHTASIDAESSYSGTASYTKTTYDPEILASFDTKIDLTKSKFTEVSDNYLMILFLFVCTFIGDEIFSDENTLTAEEHAAIILHECGHAMSTFEHVSDIYHRAETAGNSIQYLNEHPDDKDLLHVTNCISTYKFEKDKTRESQFDVILDDIKKKQKDLKGIAPEILSLGIYLTATVFFMTLTRMFFSGRYGAINDSVHKTSDTVVTESNPGYDERIADEFVSRHGLGAALASGLRKFDENLYKHNKQALNSSFRSTRAVRIIIGVLESVAHAFGMLLYVDCGRYDPLWLRLEHILKNNMVIFKDESLSPELRDHYLKETETLLVVVKSYTDSVRFKISQLFWGTIMRITSRGSILDGLHTAGLSADYDTLQQLTNGLIKNILYYHAARLQRLKCRDIQ